MVKNLKYLLLFSLSTITANAVTLEWDPSPDSWVAGYYIHAGTNSFYGTNTPATNHVIKVNCSTNLTCTLTNLQPNKYYFVATAYTADGQESLPSNEVIYTVNKTPAPPGALRTVVVQYANVVNTTNWQDVGFFRIKVGP